MRESVALPIRFQFDGARYFLGLMIRQISCLEGLPRASAACAPEGPQPMHPAQPFRATLSLVSARLHRSARSADTSLFKSNVPCLAAEAVSLGSCPCFPRSFHTGGLMTPASGSQRVQPHRSAAFHPRIRDPLDPTSREVECHESWTTPCLPEGVHGESCSRFSRSCRSSAPEGVVSWFFRRLFTMPKRSVGPPSPAHIAEALCAGAA